MVVEVVHFRDHCALKGGFLTPRNPLYIPLDKYYAIQSMAYFKQMFLLIRDYLYTYEHIQENKLLNVLSLSSHSEFWSSDCQASKW